MKNFRARIFFVSTLVVCALTAFCFICTVAEEEGTIGSTIVGHAFAKLYEVLRYPVQTLCCRIVYESGPVVFFGTLFINCLLYGFCIERLVWVVRNRFCR